MNSRRLLDLFCAPRERQLQPSEYSPKRKKKLEAGLGAPTNVHFGFNFARQMQHGVELHRFLPLLEERARLTSPNFDATELCFQSSHRHSQRPSLLIRTNRYELKCLLDIFLPFIDRYRNKSRFIALSHTELY